MAKNSPVPPEEDLDAPILIPPPKAQEPLPALPPITVHDLYQLQQSLISTSWQLYWLRQTFEKWLKYTRVALVIVAVIFLMGFSAQGVFWLMRG